MSVVARLIAVVVGALFLALAAVMLAREIALFAGFAFATPLADRWGPVFDDPSWTTTGIAALVAAVAGAGLLWLAVASQGRSEDEPVLVTFETAQGTTNVDVPALERAIRHRLETRVPDLRVRKIELDDCDTGCLLRIDADLPADDLAGVQARMGELLRDDLDRLVGLKLVAVELIVNRLLLPVQK